MTHRLRTLTLALVSSLLVINSPASTAADSNDKLVQLDHGYAMLHAALGRLKYLDAALLLKLESDAFEKQIESLSQTSARFDDRLQKLAESRADLNIQDQGLPRFELEKRSLQIRERGLQLGTPLIGESGPSMEREALLSLSGAINQQRYLIRVMREAETRPALQQWLDELREELDAVHAAYQRLLSEAHFCGTSGS